MADPPSITIEFSLARWAKENDVPYTTALRWAKNGKIPAKRYKQKVKVTVERSVRGYYVPAGTMKPE